MLPRRLPTALNRPSGYTAAATEPGRPRTGRGAGLAWVGSGVGPVGRSSSTGDRNCFRKGRLRAGGGGRAAASTLSSPRRPRSGGRGAAPPRPSGRPAGGRLSRGPGLSRASSWAALRPRGRGAAVLPRGRTGKLSAQGRGAPERSSARARGRGRGRREKGWGLPRWAGTSSPAPPSFPRKPKPRPDSPCETAAPPAGLSAERATRAAAAAAAPPGLCLSPLLWLSLRAPSERNQPPASAWASCGGQPPACCLPDARTGVPTELALSWGAWGLWAPLETGAPPKGVCAPGSPQLRPARHQGRAGLRLVSTCRDRGAWRACTLHLPCCWDWALLASGLWTVYS